MNRLHVACILVVLVGVNSWAQQQPERVQKSGPTERGSAAGQPANAKYPTEDSPFPVRVIESPSDAAGRKAREDEAAKHEKDDLEAQIRSAGAAEAQVWLTKWAIAFSALGAAGLIVSLYYARLSAKSAAEAARAAVESVHADQRPWLGVDIDVTGGIRTDDQGQKRILIKYQISHFGRSPAVNVQFHVITKALIMGTELDQPPFVTYGTNIEDEINGICRIAETFIDKGFGFGTVIFPGGVHNRSIDEIVRMPADAENGTVAPGHYVSCVCVVYKSAHGQTKHLTASAFNIWEENGFARIAPHPFTKGFRTT